MNKLFRGILVSLGLILVTNFVQAETELPVFKFFHGAECPHCQTEKKFLPVLQKMYPQVKIAEYEVWHNEENQALFEKTLSDLGKKVEGVPTNVIGDEVIVGFQKDKILRVAKKVYGEPELDLETAKNTANSTKSNKKKYIFGGILLLIVGGVLFTFKKDNSTKK